MAGYPGQQGRKPKATTIAERQRNSPETHIDRLPNAPTYLSKREKAEWTRVGRQLLEVGLIGKLDVTVLAAYCTAWGRWTEALEGIRKHGVLVKSPQGFPMQSPLLAIANKAQEQMVKLMGELGLTPAARTRIPKSQAAKAPRQTRTVHPQGDPRRVLELVK
jgi:P27 family predicted phage terminase small subunit